MLYKREESLLFFFAIKDIRWGLRRPPANNDEQSSYTNNNPQNPIILKWSSIFSPCRLFPHPPNSSSLLLVHFFFLFVIICWRAAMVRWYIQHALRKQYKWRPPPKTTDLIFIWTREKSHFNSNCFLFYFIFNPHKYHVNRMLAVVKIDSTKFFTIFLSRSLDFLSCNILLFFSFILRALSNSFSIMTAERAFLCSALNCNLRETKHF